MIAALPDFCNSEIDHGMYVLNVDLWNAEGNREVNLVRHSATSPAISATIPISFAQQSQELSAPVYSNILPAVHGSIKYEQSSPTAYQGSQSTFNPYPNAPQVNPYAQQPGQTAYNTPQQYNHHPGYTPPANGPQVYPPQNGYQGSQPPYYGAPPPMQGQNEFSPTQSAAGANYAGRHYTPNDFPLHQSSARGPVSATQPTGMFTRNLIGSLAASAFRLTDPDDRIGIWFVLQDLSVRTEGTFRYVTS